MVYRAIIKKGQTWKNVIDSALIDLNLIADLPVAINLKN